MPTRAQMQVCQLLFMLDLAALTCRCVANMPRDTGGRGTCVLSQAQIQLYQFAINPLLYNVACCPSGPSRA